MDMGSESNKTYRIVTTMDGVPILNESGDILLFKDRASVRQGAKTRTFASKERHHSRGLSKDTYFRAKKTWKQQGRIPLGFLE